MSSPIPVGTVAIEAIPFNSIRASVRFQNVGNTILYFAKSPNIPSANDFEFKINHTGNEVHFYETPSIAQFNVVSSGANGLLAIYETIYITL